MMKRELVLFSKTKFFWVILFCVLIYFPIVALTSVRGIEKPNNISNYVGIYKNESQVNTLLRQAEGNYNTSESEEERLRYKYIALACKNVANDYIEMNEVICSDQLAINNSTDFFSFLFSLNEIGYKFIFIITCIMALFFLTYSFNNKKYRLLFRGPNSRGEFIKSKLGAYCIYSLGCASFILIGNVIMALVFSPEVKMILMRFDDKYIRLSRLSYVLINYLFFLAAFIPFMIMIFLVAIIIKNEVLAMIVMASIYPGLSYWLGNNNIYIGRFIGNNALIRLGYGDAHSREFIYYIISVIVIEFVVYALVVKKYKKDEL